jgi:signal transduction histidine kinase
LLFLGGTASAVAVGLVVFWWLLRPSSNDFLAICLFLGVTSTISVLAGYAAYRGGLMRRAPRLVWTLLGGYLLAVVLVFINVLVTAGLMFISRHDLLLATVLLISASLIAVSLGYLLSSAVAESVGTLGRAASEVASGNLDVEVAEEGPDEIAELARGFNEMTRRLREMEAERDTMEATRRDLITAVGHDLRTPLSSVRVIVEALADGVVDDAETSERYLKTARRDLDTLSQLVDDLFTLAQLDSGGVQLEIRPNSLSDAVSDALGSFSVRAEQLGVELVGESLAEPDAVAFDARYVGRALSNLVDNALTYATAGSRVDIRTRTALDGVEIRVSDEGPGVAPEDVPRIFDRFYRAESSRNRRTGGGGLGLAIVKAVAEAHGGAVAVSSTPGQGATFSLTLPV